MTQAISNRDFVAAAAKVLADPVHFTERFLKGRLWKMQRDIMHSVFESPLVAVRSCHASGKTWLAARAALAWLARFPEGIVITTAPTWPQVEKLLWGEIHDAVKYSLWPYPDPFKTELRIGPRNYAMGLSTDEANRFQGFHGQVLIVVDEAPGVRPGIFTAIDGIRAGGNVHVLLLGNPTSASGHFFDAFGSSLWVKYHIDAFSTPNFRGVTEVDIADLPPSWDMLSKEEKDFLSESSHPHLITRKYVWERYHEWGAESAHYQSRVRGNFPLESDDQLFPLHLLEAARLREAEPEFPIGVGVDVAGPGDNETVLVRREGSPLTQTRAWRIPDPKGALLAAIQSANPEPMYINVDAIGIGYHVWRYLREAGLPAMPVVSGAKASDAKRFANIKAEMCWSFRELLQDGLVAGLRDEDTIAQLMGMKYSHNTRGQIEVESKKNAHRRGVPSPDRAEATIMAYSGPAQAPLRCY